MAFWRNLKGGLEEVKKKVGEKIKPYIPSVPSPQQTYRNFLGGIEATKEMVGAAPSPQRTWELFKGGIEGLKEKLLGAPETKAPAPKLPMQASISEAMPGKMPPGAAPEAKLAGISPQTTPGAGGAFSKAFESLMGPKPEAYPSEYSLISPEGQKKITEAEAATGLKGQEAIKGMRTLAEKPPTPTLEAGMAQLGMPRAEPARIDVEKQTIGVTEPTSKAAIEKRIGEINTQLDTLRMQLDMKPGATLSEKTAIENMVKGWAEAGMGAEEMAQIVDNVTRADADKLSNKIIPTYNKYLSDNPDYKKAKTTLDDLYTKYSDKESDLNNKVAEMNEAVMDNRSSTYITHAMMVGRERMIRNEYNMEISRIQNELNTLGNNIDRGRDALKTLTSEGFKMAEAEIGALKLGIEEDIMGQMPFSWGQVAEYMKTQPGEPPKTIGPGQFGWGGEGKGWEQLTPFAPTTPTSKQDKQVVTEEHQHYLEGLIGEGGFVDLEDFLAMMEDWMLRTGIYDPQKYISMFGRRYLKTEDISKIPSKLGLSPFSI